MHSLAEAAVKRGEDVIILSVGDPDFATPEPIVDSAVAALRSGDTHYTSMGGRQELRAAIAELAARRTGVSYGIDNAVVTAGTQNALFASSLCLAGHDDEIIALEPMYLTYTSTLSVGGASLKLVGQSAPDFRPDVDKIAQVITDKTRVIALTNPNNPTGVVLNPNELEGIAELARDNDLWVISDEVYCDVVFGEGFTSIASVPGMDERTVIVGSLSKSHAMTGWRIGWAVGPQALIEHIEALQVIVNYGVPGFVQEAALDAIEKYHGTAVEMRAVYQRRRDLAAKILSEVDNIDVLVPDAGMYLLLNVSRVAESSVDFCHQLFESKRVSLLDASAFGASAQGWVRLSFTVSDDRLREGCERIVDFISK